MLIRAPRGKRLTSTTLDSNDNVQVSPYDLARSAGTVLGYGADPETYALARMLASEGGGKDSGTARTLRAFVARNDAKRLGMTFVQLFTFSNIASKRGLFGKQSGRRYSTAQDPYEGDYRDAEALRQSFNTMSDPTGGADKFTDGIDPPGAWLNDGYVAIRRDDAREGFIIYRKTAKPLVA